MTPGKMTIEDRVCYEVPDSFLGNIYLKSIKILSFFETFFYDHEQTY
jgi:hypothetical protein